MMTRRKQFIFWTFVFVGLAALLWAASSNKDDADKRESGFDSLPGNSDPASPNSPVEDVTASSDDPPERSRQSVSESSESSLSKSNGSSSGASAKSNSKVTAFKPQIKPAGRRERAVSLPTGPAAGDPLDIAKKYLADHSQLFGLDTHDLTDAILKDRHVSKQNGVTHLYFRQVINGLEVANGDINISVTADGRIISAGGSFVSSDSVRNGFVPPQLSAEEAVLAAAAHLQLEVTQPLAVVKKPGGREQAVILSNGDISSEDIPVSLMYVAESSGEAALAWDVKIAANDQQHYWVMKVDARDGTVLALEDWVVHENYEVYAVPLIDPADGGRTIVTNVYLDSPSSASPFGWHDTDGTAGAEYTITRGNNAHAYEDSGNNNASIGNEPDGGAGLSFNFPINLTMEPSTYVDASVANLFYWNNILHDIHYEYGFDEASGNFQANNYGNGGSGNDYVRAEAQDGSGINNANMFTPTDGSLPRMQMYLGDNVTPFRDGSLDNLVVVHEYGHGVSTRLTGGPGNSSCLQGNQSGGMGEGWSDWWGLVLTAKSTDTGEQARAVGNWLFGEAPDGPGIRPHPYSTDMSINPHTYADIGSGVSVPHGVGSIWCAMIWEVYWGLVDAYGFDPDLYGGSGGNNIAMQLIMDGLKLQPCSPTFVDARDAIIAADVANYGGANHDILWAAFAKRGLGFSAYDGGNDNALIVTESFDIPDDLRIFPSDGLAARGDFGGPFTPSSKVYELTNSSTTAALNWTAGNNESWLDLSGTAGTLNSGSSTSVTVSINATALGLDLGIYSDTVIFSNTVSGVRQTRTVTLNNGIEHLTELFGTSAFDLAFKQLIFTPDGTTNYYSACILPATEFPTDPTGGTTVSLSDDSFEEVTLTAAVIAFFESSYGSLFIGSNGYITFGAGDSDYTESLADHFDLARISLLFDDLNPATGGTISWKQLSDRVVVTYENIPEYGTANENSFQLEIFFDGIISITYLDVAVSDGLAGLSRGQGEPTVFVNSDFSELSACIVGDVPEIEIRGTNGALIAKGNVIPSLSDGTQFGPAVVSTGLITRTFAIGNLGTSNLLISSVAFSGAHAGDFSVLSSPSDVAPATTSNLVVQFDPPAAGFRSATITVNNDDSNESNYFFAVQGSGVDTADGTDPEIAVLGTNGDVIADGDASPSLLDGTDFGTADITTGLVTRTFTITNSGPDSLILSIIEVSGVHTGDFVVFSSPAVVLPSSQGDLVVQFDPVGPGARTATINIFNNDTDESIYDFAVKGLGQNTFTGCVNSIALFFNPSYVDTSTGTSGEAYNMQQALIARGYSVNTFTGLSDADFLTAVSSSDALLIPELELGDLGSALSPAARSVISNHITGGGCMVLNGQFSGYNASFYNKVFGRSVIGSGLYAAGTSTQTTAAAGTSFAGGVTVLPGNNGTYPWRADSLPPGTLSIYELFSGGVNYSTVSILSEGSGRVVFLGYDWFDAFPIGTQDGGWDDTLGRAFNSCGTCISSTSNEMAVLGINGIEIPDGDVTPSLDDGTDFGSTDVSTGLVTHTFGITNAGPDDLIISTILVGGSQSADFSVLSNPTIVSPATTSNLVIEFNPSGTGLRMASITLFNNDVDEGAYDFIIQGTGEAPSLDTLWINEINYDTPGADSNEYVEVAGVANVNLSEYLLVLYNGSGGAPYAYYPLSGLIDDEGCGFGGVAFDTPGIQNGSPDGVALAHVMAGTTSLVQFLSYEGGMTAVGGPADGVTAISIGTQSSSTDTLQLQGSGTAGEDFTWNSGVASMGFLNSAQTIPDCIPFVPTNLSFASSGAAVFENDGTVTVVVFKTAAEGNVTAEIGLSGTATQGVDYTLSTTNISLSGVTTSQTVFITLVDDSVFEGLETLVLSFENVVGANVIPPDQFILTITDEDSLPSGSGKLVEYRFNTSPYLPPTSTAAGIAASDMALSSGTIEANITFGSYFPDEPYIEESAGWTSGSQSGAKAFQFTVTPDAGFSVTVTSITFNAYGSSAGPSGFGYDIDGGQATYAANLPNSSLVSVSQPVTGLAEKEEAFTVMIQGWLNGSRTTTGGGAFRIDDVLLYGTVQPIGGGSGDTDQDGIPDAWETEHGLNPAVSNAPSSNSDSDWMTDIEEFWADTHPTNGQSFFPNVVLTNPPPGTISFVIDPTSTQRIYSIRWSTNLLDDPQTWPVYPPEKTGNGSGITFTITNDAPERSYRTGVRLP